MKIILHFKNGLRTEIPYLYEIEIEEYPNKDIEVITQGMYKGSQTHTKTDRIERIEIIP